MALVRVGYGLYCAVLFQPSVVFVPMEPDPGPQALSCNRRRFLPLCAELLEKGAVLRPQESAEGLAGDRTIMGEKIRVVRTAFRESPQRRGYVTGTDPNGGS